MLASTEKPSHLFSRFTRLSIYNILSNLMVPLAGLCDVAFLGHLENLGPLAGVALTTIVFDCVFWTFGFLRMGTTGLSAQAKGKGDTKEEIRVLMRGLVLALAIGSFLLACNWLIEEASFALLAGDESTKLSGRAYFSARIWAAPFTLMNFVFLGWYLGRERGKIVLLLSILGNGINIALNYYFIVYLNWEAAGAGYATALSQFLLFLTNLGLCYAIWMQAWSLIKSCLERDPLMKMLSLNRDIMIRTFFLLATFGLFTNLSSSIGPLVLIANILLIRVVSLAAHITDGFAFAIESLAGQLSASGDIAELKRLIKIGMLSGVIASMIFAAAFNLFPQLFKILTDQEEALSTITHYQIWLFPVLFFGSFAYTYDGLFIGLSKGRVLRDSMTFSCLLGFVPLALIGHWLEEVHLLWLALSLFMAARFVSLHRKAQTDLPKPS